MSVKRSKAGIREAGAVKERIVEKGIVKRPKAEAKGETGPIERRPVEAPVEWIVVEERVVVKRQRATVGKRVVVKARKVPRVPLRTIPFGVTVVCVVLILIVIMRHVHILSSCTALHSFLLRICSAQLRIAARQPHRQRQQDDRRKRCTDPSCMFV